MNKIIILIFLSTIIGCTTIHKEQKLDAELEHELLMLKNQAFCNCYNASVRKVGGIPVSPHDGSSYIQISDLALKYANDSVLNSMIKNWVDKEYKSYDPKQELYLMKCLDFYNSTELNSYIDAIKDIEMNNK